MTGIIPYKNSNARQIVRAFGISRLLLYRMHFTYYWLHDIAPVILTYRLKQLGRDGIEGLPFLSPETKEQIIKWLQERSIL
ncbi:MAG: hypothetical protein ACK2UK_03745 [Candidatus Promineifilaceae bacterium]|jgi:hypothetical protein